ncbi:MAG: hypothetical protein KJ060_05490 [Candidatus Hydrogenedentes bacterium]|nr:hypothetical protein [Candidatus Hydrogenedentota bacterium]
MTQPLPDTETMPARRFAAVLAVFYAGAHVMLYAAGVRMDTSPLGVFMQYADPELLQSRLLETCWYLHIQPPLFNLFLGIVLKLFPNTFGLAFNVIYLALGFSLFIAIVMIQTRLGVSRVVAAAVAMVFVISPSYLLYEHLLAYTFPCAALLAGSAVFLDAYLRNGNARYGWLFFLTIALLGGVRATYHLVFFALVAGFVLAVMRPPRRKLVWMVAVPAMLLVSLYAKNAVLFGEFSTCSFAGKNLWIKTVGNLRWEDKVRLVEEGKLSPVSLVNRFEAVASYPESFRQIGDMPNAPVLREEAKSTGEINYNHAAQLAISRAYGADARYGLTKYPNVFVATNIQAWLNYITPGSSRAADSTNYPLLKPLTRIYDRLLYGEANIPLEESHPLLEHHDWGNRQYVFLLVGLPTLLAYGFWCGLGLGRARHRLTREQRMVILYLCGIILYVAIVGNTMELNETSRFRFETDPFYVVLAGVLLQHIMSRFARTPLWLLPAHVEARRAAAAQGAGPV